MKSIRLPVSFCFFYQAARTHHCSHATTVPHSNIWLKKKSIVIRSDEMNPGVRVQADTNKANCLLTGFSKWFIRDCKKKNAVPTCCSIFSFFICQSVLFPSLNWFISQTVSGAVAVQPVFRYKHALFSGFHSKIMQLLNTDKNAIVSGSIHWALIVKTDLRSACVSLLVFLLGSFLMVGPMGWLPAICPGIMLCMPSSHISVEVTESVCMPMHLCVSVGLCVRFFVCVPSVLRKTVMLFHRPNLLFILFL